ncbi:MAG: hypothetical protein JWM02_1137 [Frankiales bacterium]|nr:hypothetical protein [Frankiales bacterium]
MGDSGSIVLGWLTKLAATLALFGLLAFDGLSLVRASFTASDHANSVASAAVEVYKQTHDLQKAYNAAVDLATPEGETVDAKTFTVRASDGHLLLTLHREAQTLWLYRIGPLKKYVDVTAHGEGVPSQ